MSMHPQVWRYAAAAVRHGEAGVIDWAGRALFTRTEMFVSCAADVVGLCVTVCGQITEADGELCGVCVCVLCAYRERKKAEKAAAKQRQVEEEQRRQQEEAAKR